MQYEAKGLIEEFDTDGSGELEFDEFLAMLSQDPWFSLLPMDTEGVAPHTSPRLQLLAGIE